MTAPYIPGLDWLLKPKRKPTIPLGFSGIPHIDLSSLQQESDESTGTVAPETAGFAGEMPSHADDFLAGLKRAGALADKGMGLFANTPVGLAYKGAKWMGSGIGHEIGNVVDAAENVNTPGAGGKEAVFNAALPLALGLYPIGKGPQFAKEIAEELPAGIVTAAHEAERVLGRDAAGNAITNRGRVVTDPLPPAPPTVNTDAERIVERNAEGVATSRGRTVREQPRPPRPNSTVKVIQRVKELGLEAPMQAEVAMRGEATAINVEHAARTIIDVHDDLVGAGLTPEAARQTILMQHAVDAAVQPRPNPLSREGTLAREHGFMHEGGALVPGPETPQVGRFVEQGLIKEDAIGRTKALKEAGENVEMQRQPDGSWAIRRKGESQAKPKDPVAQAESALARARNDYAKATEELHAHRLSDKPADDATWNAISDRWINLRHEVSRLDDVHKLLKEGTPPDLASEIITKRADLTALQQEIEKAPWSEKSGADGEPSPAFQKLLDRQMEQVDELDAIKAKIEEAKAAAPQSTALAKAPSKAVAKIGYHGTAEESGFQSRLRTAIEYGGDKSMTPAEWRASLSKNPDVPKAELEAIFGGGQSGLRAEEVTELANIKREVDELVEWRGDPANRSRQDDALADEWERKRQRLDTLMDRKRVLDRRAETTADPATARVLDDYLDADGKLSSTDLQEFVDKHGPVSKLETTTLEGTQRKTLDDHAIEQEADYLAEQEVENWHDNVREHVRESHMALDAVKHELARHPAYGSEGAKKWLDKLESLVEHSRHERYLDEPNRAAEWLTYEGLPEADHLTAMNTEMREDYLTSLSDAIELMKQSLEEDASQMHLDLGNKNAPLTWEVRSKLRKKLDEALESERRAVEYADNIDSGDHNWEELRRQARESLEESGDYGDEPGGNTEYHAHQRVDEGAPYREILVHHRGSGLKSSHFSQSQDLAGHARGEIHDDTYLLIEAQSDAAKGVRKFGKAAADQTFATTQKAAQLSVGASLRQAATEDLGYFAWVSPKDRMSRAHLAAESAEITYGQYVPEAVERIFRWLDIPIERSKMILDHSPGFDRVKLTPEARRRILKAGIPALGLAGALTVDKVAGKPGR